MFYTVKVKMQVQKIDKVREMWVAVATGKTKEEAQKIKADLYAEADKQHLRKRRRPEVQIVPERTVKTEEKVV